MEPREFTDHLGRKVTIRPTPQRIISLCPSQTRTLIDLGLQHRLAGRTHFCIHPAEAVEGITKVGGTKRVKMERIKAIQPDLIVAEKEENTQEMVEALEKEFPVYVTDVKDEGTCLQMIRDLGEITGRTSEGVELARRVERAMATVKVRESQETCLYFIWRKPWMVVGPGTFIHEIMLRCGWDNAITTPRYPELSPEQLAEIRPDRVFLSTEPFPFEEKHIEELRAYFPEARFDLVNGEMFSWYGSHLLLAPEYLNELIDS